MKLSVRAIITVSVLSYAAGCRGDDETGDDILKLSIGSSKTVSSIVPQRGRATIVVFSPKHCFTCDNSLMRLAQSARSPDSLVLVSSKTPTPAEDVMLRQFRISVAGTIDAKLSDSVLVVQTVDGRVQSIAHNPSSLQMNEITKARALTR